MNTRRMEARDAADYVGTSMDYLLNQAKMKRVAHILTSPKKIMFEKDDLDTWMASWRKVEVAAR